MAKRGAKGTLREAAQFLADEASQLAMLTLLVAINDGNLAALQGDAAKAWSKSSSGWHRQLSLWGGSAYDARKQALAGHVESGVLSGGWKAYRRLDEGDITLSQRGKGRPRLTFSALPYGAKERRIRAAYEGSGTIPAKPWRNWPQRTVSLDGCKFEVPTAAAIKGLHASMIKDLTKELPLAGARINFNRLTREGRRIGTIRKKRAKIQAALRRAIENAV